MPLNGGDVPLKLGASDKALLDHLLANIVDEVEQDQTPGIRRPGLGAEET